jgi:lauroyl/myristoyl acyltransferase
LSIQRLGKSVTRFLDLRRASSYLIALRPLVAFLPAPLAYKVAYLHGNWCYRWDTYAREWIIRALTNVLGDQLSPAERVRVTRDYFCLRSCETVDLMRLAGKGRALARLVEIRGLEHIEAALAAGKGAILCSAHFGSYDSCFSLIGARGFPITVIGRWPSGDRPIERFFFQLVHYKPVGHHRRPNIQPRPGNFGAAVQAVTALRQNELIATFLDPPVFAADRKRAVSVDFLNGQVLLLPGAITIAQLTGAPVLMTFMRRSADWRHQVLEISPPMPLDGDAVADFKRCLAVVEAAIRQDPAHWFFWYVPSELVELGLLPEEAIRAHDEFIATQTFPKDGWPTQDTGSSAAHGAEPGDVASEELTQSDGT